MSETQFKIKTGWPSVELPGYREHPEWAATYTLFSYEGLPPVQDNIDDDFRWLETEPVKEGSLTKGVYSNGSKPDLGKLLNIIAQIDITLPEPFLTFINSTNLHSRIRSCTDCYLDLADRAVKIRGALSGFLIHFLSDSQWCCHWYIHVSHSGEHFIAASLEPYGFNVSDEDLDCYPTCRKDEIELENEEIWFCSPTFTEFVYRFWLENEIWFALEWDERPLTATQKEYVNHYLCTTG